MDDMLEKVRIVWPQISEDTTVISARRETMIIPVLNDLPPQWDKPWPQYEFAGWFDRLTWCGKLWRTIGKIFKSKKLYRRGQFPHYRETNPAFSQVTIRLQKYSNLDFRAGYDTEHDILVVGKTETPI